MRPTKGEAVAGVMSASAVADFATRVGGEVIVPGDASYDEARRVFNAMVDRRPAVIARCASNEDVVAAVEFGRANDLPIAVRAGGHSVPGYGVCDDGIVIDLSGMKRIVVDAERRTAVAQGGALWGELDAATQEHGLAVTGGRVSTTGVAGLCLGSGSGWLERMHGLTSDSLIRATVVTADGRVVEASASENADLFWALHGGSGNFGIVTEFEFGLHQVGPIVFAGMLAWPRPMAGEVLRAYRDFMEAAPDEVGGAFAFITAPPAPFVPVEAQGQPAVAVVVAYFGDPDDGPAAYAPLLELGPPVVAMVAPMPYVALQQLLDESNTSGHYNYWKAEFLEELTDEAIDVMVEHANRISSPHTQLLVAPAMGSMARVDESSTVLGHRQCKWNFHGIGVWEDPAENDVHIEWARTFSDAMQPHATAGVYLNYTSDEGLDRVRATYGDRYERIVAVKRAWDPDNVFCINQNIDPNA